MPVGSTKSAKNSRNRAAEEQLANSKWQLAKTRKNHTADDTDRKKASQQQWPRSLPLSG
jgi:hypothetical protein